MNLISFVLTLVVLGQPSVPTTGQFNRFRGAPQNSLLSIVPVDGAEFLLGQHFDISIELHNVGVKDSFPSLDTLSATITPPGKQPVPLDIGLNATFERRERWNFEYFESAERKIANRPTAVSVTRLAIRSVQIQTPGIYKINLSVGNEKVVAEWNVRKQGEKKVKNVVLMIGDGMNSGMQTIARYLSKKTKFGKFGDNLLEMEKLGTVGKIITNGIDSIITDSANSAASYTTGQKTWNGALNVYADTSSDPFDDPKVESIAEMIKRTREGMCIGIVTTAEVMDATPASVFSHTRSRGTSKEIVDQMINGPSRKDLKWTPKAVKADVLMGGGGRVFCTGQTSCSSNNNTDYYSEFKKLGYNVVKSKSQLESLTGTDPLLGIFSLRHLDTWIDKALYPENLQLSQSDPDGFARSNSDQPGLETMTKAALNVLSSQTRCPNGFFLMVEAGHIDKAMHVIDYDRGLGELLELDRTVKIVRQFAETNKPSGETAIFLTSDHGQAYDAYGTVDTQLFNTAPENDANIIKQPLATQQFLQIQKRRSIQEYEDAGWPDLVVDDNGMPTKWEGRFRVTGGKVGTMPHREDFQFKKRPERGTNPLYRKAYQKDSFLGTLFNFDNVIVENPNERGIYITGTLPVESGATVHSPTAVDLYCYGPAEIKLNCAKVMDNTELFFIMADAIGL